MYEEMSLEETLYRLVRPRPDWFDIDAVQLGLSRVLTEFRALAIPLTRFDQLMQICNSQRLRDVVAAEPGLKGVKGLKTDYPQHAALHELGKRSEVSSDLCQLAALVICTLEKWDKRICSGAYDEKDVAMFSRRLEAIWRQVRLISEIGVELLPPVTRDVETFYNALDDVIEQLDPREKEALGTDYAYLVEIRRFFNFYLGGGRIYERSRKGSEPGRTIESSSLNVSTDFSDPESELAPDSSHDNVLGSRRNWDQIRESEIYKAGNSPDELEDGPRLMRAHQALASAHGGSFKQVAIRARNRLVHQ